MTATISADLTPRTAPATHAALRLMAMIAILALLAVGAFALGRATADATSAAVTSHTTPQVQTVTPPVQDPCTRVATVGC